MKKKSGFTVIELMIVLFIVGILALIGIPKYSNILTLNNKNEAKGEMRALKAAFTSYFTVADQYPPGSECNAGSADTGINTVAKWQSILIDGVIAPGSPYTILTSSHNWRGPYISKIPTDPWGNSYILRCYGSATDNADTYKTAIVCTGPSGQLISCNHLGVPFSPFTYGIKQNHNPDKDGTSIIYNPDITPNRSDYNIYLWLE